MTVTNIIEGLQLIQKSKPKSESDYHFRAEHDEIFVGSIEWNMPAEDILRMEELGWKADAEVDGWRAYV